MTASYHYIAHDEAWDVNLGSQAVRLGGIPGFTELAEMGAVGNATLVVDSVSDIGHASDNILAYQQFAYDDDAAAEARIFMGWTRDRKYYRGTDSLRQGAQRKCEITLEDGNTLAGRRIIKPKTLDPSVNRPAESPAARIAWLLGTAYFSGVVDNGLVHPKSSPTLTANNFEGQNAADVMNDVCTATGDNWFVRWNRADALWELVVYNFTTYDGDAGTLILSNDPALVDSNLVDGAGPTNCWAVTADATLSRDPSTLATGCLYAWSGGSVYEDTTSTDYPLIDHSASSTSVRTAALATTKALRYIADNDTEHHRITCTAQITAANVNDAYAGQLIVGSFMHLPGYQSPTYFRIARRTVAQIAMADDFYTVSYELVPAAPATAVYSFAQLQLAVGNAGITSPDELNWKNTGDVPATGWTPHPKTGLVAYDATGAITGGWNTGIKLLGDGTVTAYVKASVEMCDIGYSFPLTLSLKQNGVTVATDTLPDSSTGAHCVNGELALTASVAGVSGDIFTAVWTWSGSPSSRAIPSSAVAKDELYLSVTGFLS